MAVKVVIFCGGQGTRIRDVADNIPKPLIQIGERPILWHIMKRYAHYGVRDFVLCLGYKGWQIKEFFLNYQSYISDMTISLRRDALVTFHGDVPEQDWTITFAETGLDTQTGGRLWQARKYLQDDDVFCVTYGDGVADIDIEKLIEFHRAHGKIGTVTGVHPPGRFGVLDVQHMDGIQTVVNFAEKPQVVEGMINGGFFVFDHRLWDYLEADNGLVFEGKPLIRLAQDQQLAVYEHQGFWQPMDTFRDWKYLNQLLEKGEAPWLT